MHVNSFPVLKDGITVAEASELVWTAMREEGKPLQTDEDGRVTCVEVNQRTIINRLFADYKVGPRATFGNSRIALEWHASISVFLKYSGMVTMIKRPSGPHAANPRETQWRLADVWDPATEETIIERARQTREVRHADSENPYRAVLSTARAMSDNVPEELVPIVLEPPSPLSVSFDPADIENMDDARTIIPTPVLMPQRQEDSELADPALALQWLIRDRDTLRTRVKQQERQIEDLTASRDHFKTRYENAHRALEGIGDRIDDYIKKGTI